MRKKKESKLMDGRMKLTRRILTNCCVYFLERRLSYSSSAMRVPLVIYVYIHTCIHAYIFEYVKKLLCNIN